MTDKEISHYKRFRGYDYSRGASFFITIVTSPRHSWFGKINNARVELTDFGKVVDESIRFTLSRIKGLRLQRYVVMPDHIHVRVYLAPGLSEPLKVLGAFANRLKSWTTKVFHQDHPTDVTLWQQGYHDLICMSEQMIDAVDRYIDYNPLKYELRYRNKIALKLHEPLESFRFNGSEFWRGVGAVDLLNDKREMIALRVSRRTTNERIEKAVRRIKALADKFTIISGFISPGERAIFDALSANPNGRMIKVLPFSMAHDYTPPSSLLPLINEGRLAIIARGNSPEELSRKACLDLNAAIIPIAEKAGRAVYLV
jgi:REP element-mobilizing transposase RayT